MLELIIIFCLLGSCSLGYGIARIGFPALQRTELITKLGAGYLLGVILLGIPFAIVVLMRVNETYYFGICLFFIGLVSAVLYAKRYSTQETDPELIVEEKKRVALPNRLLTPEERIAREQNPIEFEEGLMVKANTPPVEVVSPLETKKQVFKEKEDSILRVVESKTKFIENKNAEDKKTLALERMRKLAQEIEEKKKKAPAEELDTVEEDLLNKLNTESEESF